MKGGWINSNPPKAPQDKGGVHLEAFAVKTALGREVFHISPVKGGEIISNPPRAPQDKGGVHLEALAVKTALGREVFTALL